MIGNCPRIGHPCLKQELATLSSFDVESFYAISHMKAIGELNEVEEAAESLDAFDGASAENKMHSRTEPRAFG